MNLLLAFFLFLGLIPLAKAWHANRGSSLTHAVAWAIAAWIAWIGVLTWMPAVQQDMDPARYAALCLIGGSGVAVLGARRPHVGAWNFVVLGLLAVMLLPIAEGMLLGTHSTDGVRVYFLGGTLAVGVLNYLPTRHWPASLGLVAWCVGQMTILHAPHWLPSWLDIWMIDIILPPLPWLVWWRITQSHAEATPADQIWRDFRDRFGMVWSQRVAEQFNHAAEHAGVPVTLRWHGLEETGAMADGDRVKIVEMLRATMQRFLAKE